MNKMKNGIDERDIAIIRVLQQNADISLAKLSEKVNLSRTPCWKRLQRLKKQGYIQKIIAVLNPNKFGKTIRMLVLLETSGHNSEWLDSFSTKVGSMAEVVRFYRLTGVSDYFLEILLPDIRAYDIFYRNLLGAKQVTKVTSMVVMEDIKDIVDVEL